jgi:hypothetical protein
MAKTLFLFIAIFNASITLAQFENPLPYKYHQPEYDTAPMYIGGSAAMMAFIDSSIIFPEPEKTKKLKGNVCVKIDIDSVGQVVKVTSINGVPGAPNFVNEAQRVLLKMPRWIPAKKNGKPISATYYLSVPFKQ